MEPTSKTIDKSTWGPGPWQTEPDRLEWKHAGLPCLIVRVEHHGALCGYAAVPPGHPLHGQEMGEPPVDVHGGLTYAAKCAGDICHVPAPGEPDDVWWFGFDCAHSGDQTPGSDASLSFRAYRGRADEYRTIEYVKAEVERLAEQLAEATS
jgi:hypothetical protein